MGRFGAIGSLALLCSAQAVLGQNATTSVRGVVQDSTGAAIPGAVVTLVDPAAGRTLKATCNAQGEYELVQITPARYTVTATAPGFGKSVKQAELLVNQPATLNFSVGIESTTIVSVTEETQTLNDTDATLGNAFDNATIQALPTETRNVPDLLSLQPGVFYVQPPQNVATEDSRSGAVNGERSDQSNVTLDGVDDNDQLRGLAFFGVLRETQDSIQEFRVVTSNANADEGRSSGAQVTMITKSGTDKYHRAAYEYYRPTNTVANDISISRVSWPRVCPIDRPSSCATSSAVTWAGSSSRTSCSSSAITRVSGWPKIRWLYRPHPRRFISRGRCSICRTAQSRRSARPR